MNVLEVNVLVLAYLGDTIYENYVRRYLIHKGIGNVNDLQKEAIHFVSATSQASYLTKMIEETIIIITPIINTNINIMVTTMSVLSFLLIKLSFVYIS